MFPIIDAEFQLDLHYQRAAEWRRVAAADHLAHEVTGGHRHRRRWHWPARKARAVRGPAAS